MNECKTCNPKHTPELSIKGAVYLYIISSMSCDWIFKENMMYVSQMVGFELQFHMVEKKKLSWAAVLHCCFAKTKVNIKPFFASSEEDIELAKFNDCWIYLWQSGDSTVLPKNKGVQNKLLFFLAKMIFSPKTIFSITETIWVIPQYCPKIGVFKINFFFFWLKWFFHPKQFSVLQRPYMKEIKKDKKLRICHPSQKLWHIFS